MKLFVVLLAVFLFVYVFIPQGIMASNKREIAHGSGGDSWMWKLGQAYGDYVPFVTKSKYVSAEDVRQGNALMKKNREYLDSFNANGSADSAKQTARSRNMSKSKRKRKVSRKVTRKKRR